MDPFLHLLHSCIFCIFGLTEPSCELLVLFFLLFLLVLLSTWERRVRGAILLVDFVLRSRGLQAPGPHDTLDPEPMTIFLSHVSPFR